MTTDVELDPSRHCFREDGCATHGDYPPAAPNLCCCCRQAPEIHSGCDCERDAIDDLDDRLNLEAAREILVDPTSPLHDFARSIIAKAER